LGFMPHRAARDREGDVTVLQPATSFLAPFCDDDGKLGILE